MPPTSAFLIPLCAAAVLVSSGAAQNSQNPPELLGARDMFYRPVQEETASAAAPQKAVPTKPGKPAAKPKPTEVAKASPDKASPDKAPQRPPASNSQPQTRDDGVSIIRASAPTAGTALGLRYSLLKKGTEIATDTIFHTGDQIQLRMETNQPAYIYIISQGSSGTWKVLVPSADAPGSNHIENKNPYYFPSRDHAFGFTEPKGAEKLFVIVTRDPVANIQDQIYGLQGKPGKPDPVAQPEPPSQHKSAVIQALTDLPDDKIAKFRQMYSRDLIIERVNPDTTGDKEEKKEFAVYVVNPTGRADSRLVADISLEHQ